MLYIFIESLIFFIIFYKKIHKDQLSLFRQAGPWVAIDIFPIFVQY